MRVFIGPAWWEDQTPVRILFTDKGNLAQHIERARERERAEKRERKKERRGDRDWEREHKRHRWTE